MGYIPEVYRAVKDLLDARRRAAVAESERRRAALHERSPEAAEIDRALSGTGLLLFRAACEGGCDGEAYRRAEAETKALIENRRALLRSLGLPEDYTEVHYTCPACADTGYVDITMCDCMKRELMLAGLRASGLGALVDRQSFDNFSLDYYREENGDRAHMAKVLARVRQYGEGFDMDAGNLLFFGATGLGKTHLSTALARAVIARGYDVCYDSAPAVFTAFERDRFSREDGTEHPSNRYLTTDLLILDDLGAESATPYTVSCLYNLLNGRITAGRPTVISSNLDAVGIQNRYNDRIASRLMSEFRPFPFVGRDIRRQKLGL